MTIHFSEELAKSLQKARELDTEIICHPVDPPYVFHLKKIWRKVVSCLGLDSDISFTIEHKVNKQKEKEE